MAIQEPSTTPNETPSLGDELNKVSCELEGLSSLLRYMEYFHQADDPMLVESLNVLNAHLSHLAERVSLAGVQAAELEKETA